MARTPHDFTGGQSDSHGGQQGTTMDAASGAKMTLPGNEFVTDAQMLRDGQDLILRAPDGEEITVQNYFSADPVPVIVSEGGAALTPDLVDSFVKPVDGIQFAQKGSVDDASPVGVVKEASGEATITHPNGVVEQASVGTPIYEGDIVETKGDGAVNITFIDDTTFAVSENARLAIDEYVFDPATQSGESNFSVLRGVFVFTSGLIGREDPDDVQIDTPVGSIGIRGTTIMGDINPDGESQITVVEGAIVVKNAEGEQTLSQQFETVTLSGFNEPMTSEGVLDASQIANDYNVVRTVSAPLFSTFDDMGTETGDQPADEAPLETAPVETNEESAPVDDAAPVTNESPAETEPVNKTETAPVDETILTESTTAETTGETSFEAGFDSSAGLKTDAAFTSSEPVPSSLNIAPSPTVQQTTTAPLPPPPTGTKSGTTTTTENSIGEVKTVLPPLALDFVSQPIDEVSLAPGMVVGIVKTTVDYSGVSFRWTSLPEDGSGNPLFVMEQSGPNRIAIKLTADGAAFLSNGMAPSFGVAAQLQDGRSTTGTSQIVISDLSNFDLSLNDVVDGTAGAGTRYIDNVEANSGHGFGAAALGDVNHDGRADYAFVNNQATNGNLFVDDNQGNNYLIDLGLGAFALNDTTSLMIAGIGDFDGDGNGDIAIGAKMADDGGQINSGKVFIANGAAPGTAPIEITGFVAGEFAGFSIAGAGDFNGDGLSDLIIGAPEPSGYGKSYVVFGDDSGTIDVSGAFAGFVIAGGLGDELGREVTGIGDLNKDGYSDIAVSDPGQGLVRVYFGNNAGIQQTPLIINNIGVDGGDPGIPVVSMGDMNGDGFADLGVADKLNDTLHIFYGAAGLSGTIDAGIYTNQLKIVAGSDIIGGGSAGDFNGDGRDDGVIATRTGDMVDVVVFYGRAGAIGSLNLDGAPAQDVFHMTLDLASPQFGLANPATDAINIEVSSAGDLNGDGFDDLLIGLPDLGTGDGGLLIVYGRAEGGNVVMGNAANAFGQSLIGSAGMDIMTNYDGTTAHSGIAFSGGQGNDTINLHGNLNSREIDGGGGLDTLNLATGSLINLRGLGENLSGIEKIMLGSTSQNLTIGIDQIFSLMQDSANRTLAFDTLQTGTTLTIHDNGDSATNLGGLGFTSGGNVGGNDVWTFGGYTLLINDDIATTVAV